MRPVTKEDKLLNSDLYNCPDCGGYIETAFDYCPHCGEFIYWENEDATEKRGLNKGRNLSEVSDVVKKAYGPAITKIFEKNQDDRII